MANTTKDEFPTEKVPKKTGVEKEITERYDRGENLYKIAGEVYGFTSEEAVARVRQVLGIMQPPANRKG